MVTIVQGNVDNFDRNKLEIANVSEYRVGFRSSTGTGTGTGTILKQWFPHSHSVIIFKLNGNVYLRSSK